MNDWLEITAQPLPTEKAIAFVTEPNAGGIATFLGTTRSETKDGRELLALDYEAYESMATKQFADYARDARSRWPIARLAILHRTGRVEIGQPSVLIAVSTPHRADAFAACQGIIDALKSSAAIWKKEVWSAGPATWVRPN